jgi:O-methyltransferase involved in polyketide biosynthesis
MESDRPDALFRDPYARKLTGPEGEAILRGIPKGQSLAWPMIVRTQVMDELILRTIKQDGIDTVLNLAAGLDARPYRLPLPAALRWVEADFPDVIAYKQSHLAGDQPRCVLESAKRTLVVTEGLIAYLQREQVAGLASDLSAQMSFRWWLIDLASPDLLKRLNRTIGKSLQRAPLIFGPAEGTKFFEPYGWREAEFRSMFEESVRLKRTMRFAGFFQLLGRLAPKKKQESFRRMSGVVLLGKK